MRKRAVRGGNETGNATDDGGNAARVRSTRRVLRTHWMQGGHTVQSMRDDRGREAMRQMSCSGILRERTPKGGVEGSQKDMRAERRSLERESLEENDDEI